MPPVIEKAVKNLNFYLRQVSIRAPSDQVRILYEKLALQANTLTLNKLKVLLIDSQHQLRSSLQH